MKKETAEKAFMYHSVNGIALRGEIVVFGSTFMANFPFYELSQKYVMSSAVYNRSVEDLTISDAAEILDDCVLSLKPAKVFLALGEKDVNDPGAIAEYGQILQRIRRKLPKTKIYVLSLPKADDEAEKDFNARLRALTERMDATYIDLSALAAREKPYEKIFKRLNSFFHGSRLGFAQAFSLA